MSSHGFTYISSAMWRFPVYLYLSHQVRWSLWDGVSYSNQKEIDFSPSRPPRNHLRWVALSSWLDSCTISSKVIVPNLSLFLFQRFQLLRTYNDAHKTPFNLHICFFSSQRGPRQNISSDNVRLRLFPIRMTLPWYCRRLEILYVPKVHLAIKRVPCTSYSKP